MSKTCTTISATAGREARDTAIREWLSNPGSTLSFDLSPAQAEAVCRHLAEVLPQLFAAGHVVSASCELRPADTAP